MTGASLGAFTIGVFFDSEIYEKLDLLTSVGFGIGEKVDDESNNSIGIGVGLQYYPTGKDGNFFIQPGLGLGFSLANIDTDFIKKTVFSGSIGLGVDISESFTVIGSYESQLSNSSTINGIEIKANSIGVTLQYKF